MLRLQIIAGKRAGQTLLVRRFPFQIGRSPACDLVLDDSGVWEKHARIDHVRKEGLVLSVSAETVAHIDARPVAGEVRLENAVEIAFGGARIRFTMADPPARSLRLREAVVWGFLTAVILFEVWLIRRLG